MLIALLEISSFIYLPFFSCCHLTLTPESAIFKFRLDGIRSKRTYAPPITMCTHKDRNISNKCVGKTLFQVKSRQKCRLPPYRTRIVNIYNHWHETGAVVRSFDVANGL